MTKLNFNVPYLDEKGDPVQNVKREKKNQFDDKGNVYNPIMKDANNNPVMETMTVREMISKTLRGNYAGDEAIAFGEKVKREKLARKLLTSSTANYRDVDTIMIKDYVAKGGNVLLAGQVEDIIEPPSDEADVAETDPKTDVDTKEPVAA